MATLYVTEPGVQVHKQGQRLILKRSGAVVQEIPMIKVDRVVLMGKGVGITTPTLHALTQNKVEVYYLSANGRFIMRTVGLDHRHSRVRQSQALATSKPELTMSIARAIVNGKINNQRVLVQRHSEGASWAREALAQMDDMRRQLNSSTSLDELRGREGLAARAYFGLLRRILRPPSDGQAWGFERRSYYPPTDPINALLSFGYTLLLNEIVSACQLAGLDSALGYFHAIDYNRPSMALDLEEEFRPVIVDSIVLTAVNRPLLNLHDFEAGQPRNLSGEDEDIHPPSSALSVQVSNSTEPGRKNGPPNSTRPVYLKAAARKRFINLYEMRVNEQVIYPPTGEKTSYRRIFELQAYAMARLILGESDKYIPFMVR